MRPFADILRAAAVLGMGLAACCTGAAAAGPPRTGPHAVARAPAEDASPGMVTLNFQENLELKALVDYVGQRQGVNFIYDEQIVGKRVTIKAPTKVPADSLMTLLESVLKMKGMMIVPTGVDGLMRIEAAEQLTVKAIGPEVGPDVSLQKRPAVAVTRVFELKHAGTQRLEAVLKPFLSAATANLTPLPESNMVIITDYAGNMPRLESLLAVVDRPRPEAVIRFVTVTHQEASAMAQHVTQLLAAKSKVRGGEPERATSKTAAAAPAVDVTIVANERMNQVAVVGDAEDVDEVVALIGTLDAPLGLETKMYPLGVASAEQVDGLVKELIGEVAAKRLYKSVTDRDANLLIVTATPEVHKQVDDLCRMMDKPMADAQSPIRFYKLKNAKAIDVLETLQSIEGEAGLADLSIDGVSAAAGGPDGLVIKGPTEAEVNREADAAGAEAAAGPQAPAPRRTSVELKNARIMADEASNTIIVVARPAMHPVYESLIRRLDVRRPQVLVEATVVVLDTTDGFELGVELIGDSTVDGGTMLLFSQFGLTTRDPATGTFAVNPGIGFNGALLGADTANAVVYALETDSRAKVVARPSVLINDNATGTLVSEREEPFESVNASTTVATTSFGGYTAAGTNIKITPQISEGDHLKLEYDITLSSFNDDRTATLPPSRQTNSLTSEATIPDGYTIVVGGLTRENTSKVVNKIPLLGSIPGLEYLFSRRSDTVQQTTLFVFIRAVILRDDKFRDLKALSRSAAGRADLAEDYPASEPVAVY